MNLLFTLLQHMSVFAVIAYLYSKTSGFKTLLSPSVGAKELTLTYLFFSSITIMGSYMGLPINDALANTRAIGAVISGLIGGPVMGGAVGLTAGIHRFIMGGFTDVACGISTTLEGLIGGLFHYYLIKHRRHDQIFSYRIAFVATFISETVQMLVILIVAKPFADAWGLVQVIAMPMIVSNSLGAALFISILKDQKSMIDEYGALYSKKALSVAEKSIHLFSKGFTDETPIELARVLKTDIGVSAVAVTDREKILAFEGEGSDHHVVGSPITSNFTKECVQTEQVVFADGITNSFECVLDDHCQLNSVLVVPLLLDTELIGTIQLFESRNKRFHNINKSFGEGLVNLLSTQLLIAKYSEQKTLLIQSELKLLHAQVDPHFLFNTLNTIVSVTRVAPDKAIELIQHLSNMFRKNLKRQHQVSRLAEDLDHVNSYLIIEKARFDSRLNVDIDVDNSLMHVSIPTFTLQPLVENAIKHGMGKIMGNMDITIRCKRVGDHAKLEVIDNAGVCNSTSKEEDHTGMGLSIVEKRIKSLWGEDYGLKLSCNPGVSTSVEILIPMAGEYEDV